MLLIDTCVLILLVKTFIDEDSGFLGALLIALGASIGLSLLAGLLHPAVGILFALILASVIGSFLLGCIVSWVYGSDVKVGVKVGAIFLAVHLVCAIGLSLLFHGS